MDSVGIIIALVFAIIGIATMWMIYQKAGRPGWASIIPIYNYWVLLDIVGRPQLLWLILLFIPVVNWIIIIIVYFDLARVFGKSTGFGCGMLLLPFIFLPILAFGDAEYIGDSPKAKRGDMNAF